VANLQYLESLWFSFILISNIFESQLISNDKFKSAQHRVLTNLANPRVSIACFFSMLHHPSTRTYGPIKELLSEENSAKYRETSISELAVQYTTKCTNDTSPLLHFRI